MPGGLKATRRQDMANAAFARVFPRKTPYFGIIRNKGRMSLVVAYARLYDVILVFKQGISGNGTFFVA